MKKILYLFTTLILILTLTSCKKEKKETEIKEIKIVAPSGAPALSQVKIAHDALKDDFNIADYKINFRTVNGAEGIKAEITNKSSDIIIAPINLGVNLYNSNKTYKYAANITDGNIYLASTTNFTLEDLKTRPLVFFGQNTINEAVIGKILEYNNIARNDITYLNSTSDTQTQLVADKETETIYLIAEPVLTAAKNALAKQNKTVYTIDVQNEFKIATSGMDFLQAGVFVKDGVNKDFVEAYLQALEDSIDFVNEHPSDASNYATELELGLPAQAVLEKAIPGCNLHFRLASDCKNSLEALFNLNPKLFGGSINSELYY